MASDIFVSQGFLCANAVPTPGQFVTRSFTDGVSAAGTTQGTATNVTTQIVVVATCALNAGIVLDPTMMVPGAVIYVRNNGANPCAVYPPLGGAFDALAANASVAVAAGATGRYLVLSATNLRTVT